MDKITRKNEDSIADFSTKLLWGEGFDKLISFLCPIAELAICGKQLSDDIVDGAYTIFGSNLYYSAEVGIADPTYLELGEDAGVAYAFVTGIHHVLSLGVRKVDVVYERFKLIDYFREGGMPRTTAEYGLFEFAKWIPAHGLEIQYIKKQRKEYKPLIEMIGEDE